MDRETDLKYELFVISEAGKPIYTYTKSDDGSTLIPLCSALVNYAKKTQGEELTSMKTSDNLIVNFSTRPPLIIIIIHEASSNIEPVMLMDQVEAQIVSILTAKTLRSVFEERPTYDLKRSLYGSEKLIDSIARIGHRSMTFDWPQVQAFLAVSSSNNQASQIPTSPLGVPANQTLPTRPHRILIPMVAMPSTMRDNLQSILINQIASHSKNIVFSLLFRVQRVNVDGDTDDNEEASLENTDEDSRGSRYLDFQLITICNHVSKYKLKVADIHIIYALLNGSKAQLSSVESLWMPVCLPRFNEDAFLHSYSAFTNQKRNCLVMFSVDREEFSNCQEAKNAIEERIDTIFKDTTQRSKLYYQMSPLVHPVLLELQEKLTGCSLTDEELIEAQQKAQIYNSKAELYHARQLQFLWYQTNKQVIWWQRSTREPLSPILYYVTKKMLQSSLKTLWMKLKDESTFLGWHVPTFQLYTQFDRSVSTNEATEVIQRITSWIKKEEDNFSIADYK